MNNICIFEDEHYVNFLPLVYTRPVYELICGKTTLKEKITRCFPRMTINLHCRSYLAPVLKKSFPNVPVNRLSGQSCLFINGRILPEENLSAILSREKAEEMVFLKDDEIAAVRIEGQKLKEVKKVLRQEPMKLSWQLKQFIPGLPKKKLGREVKLARYLWELVNQNSCWIKKDARITKKLGKCLSPIPAGAYLINDRNIFIDRGVKISPGVVMNAEEGPIIIGKNVRILPQVTIEGPVCVGAGSSLKAGAKIYSGTTLGEGCKIGGEIENSIFLNFTNKQHDGFIGHSYLGSWINLGAETTNSDLKNNYSPIKIFIDGKYIDTELTFVGVFMGDHSKSGINTIFNAGTVVGVSCNLFGSNLFPKFVPSFSWGEKGRMETYRLEKSLQTASRVMARRDKKLSLAEKQLLAGIFNLTKPERDFS